jgi:hypothetical protein
MERTWKQGGDGTVDFEHALANAITRVSVEHCRSYFEACGYTRTRQQSEEEVAAGAALELLDMLFKGGEDSDAKVHVRWLQPHIHIARPNKSSKRVFMACVYLGGAKCDTVHLVHQMI